jgi:perosamine synthetase
MGFIAPAGTPIALSTTAAALLKGWIQPGARDNLGTGLANLAGHTRCSLVSTGRAAMTLTLRAMHRLAAVSDRCEVIVPAYTCYSVPAAVFKAGLQVRLCDIDPETLSLDLDRLEQMDTGRVLAIASANLYGLPNDLERIEGFARRRGLFMLDDAAQAMGAFISDRPAGGFGDAGLFSLDKGKNITSLEGGAILASRPDLLGSLDEELRTALPTRATRTAGTAIKLLLYSVMLRPTAYGAISSLPFLGLGRTPYDEKYELAEYSPVLAGVALRLLKELPELTHIRRRNAEALLRSLADQSGIIAPKLLPGARPAYARLPVFSRKAELRDQIVERLVAAGIGATRSYPLALNRVAEVAARLPSTDLQQPGAERVAQTIITLPTHPYVPADLGPRISQIVSEALA